MKTLFFIIITCTIGISTSAQMNDSPEQIAFDYFTSDIIKQDFKDLSAIEFKGKTEEDFATLGEFTFCLTPERLGKMIKSLSQGKTQEKEIRYNNLPNLTINKFTQDEKAAKLLLYRSAHVANSYYVLLKLKLPQKSPITYIFEITQEGKVSRDCKAN